jgi:uncharacterized membrane protein
VGCLGLLLPIIITLPLVLALVFFNVITISFGKLGLSPEAAIAILIATLIGSMINIPLTRRRVECEEPQPAYAPYLFYMPPKVKEQVVAINLGGAIIPAGVAIYLFTQAPIGPTLITLAAVTLVAKLLARLVPGVGITLPGWIPPIISAGLAFLLARDNPAPVAFIAGTLGTLIGADLLNWPNFRKLGSQVISIGGAGVFDGVFLSGIIAALLT